MVDYLVSEGGLEQPELDVRNSADIKDKDSDLLEKALESASYYGDLEIVQYLINSGRIRKLDNNCIREAIKTALKESFDQIALLLMEVLMPLAKIPLAKIPLAKKSYIWHGMPGESSKKPEQISE